MNEKEYFCVPRNVRQIGEVPDECRIYIEDYAYTFLCQPLREDEKGKICLLLGTCCWKEKTQYVFVKSALLAEGVITDENAIVFDDDAWGDLSNQRKKYFSKQEIVGWFLTMTNQPVAVTETMQRVQRNYFAENGKVLFLLEPEEKEEAFFLYEQDKLVRQKGYYIYYERNEPMQEYLVEQNHNESIEVQGIVKDKAVKDFRKIIEEKNQEKDTKHTNRFLYAASACLVIAVVGAGLSVTNHLLDIGNLQDAVQTTAERVMGVVDTKSAKTPSITNDATDMQKNRTVETEAPTETINPTETAEPTETIQPTETPAPSTSVVPEETPSEETAADTVADYAAYTVREGDTLNVISYRYYGTIFEVQDICSLNNISPEDIIYPGQKILLP